MKYVHFTSPEDAQKIVDTGFLWKSSFVNGVFAVAVGGQFVPGVQHTALGRTKDRSAAVVFETDELPDVAFPEEVIWHMDRVPIRDAQVMPAATAAKLLDGSIKKNPDEWLEIPVHPSKMDWHSMERVRLPRNAHEAIAHQVAANMMHQERLKKLRR